MNRLVSATVLLLCCVVMVPHCSRGEDDDVMVDVEEGSSVVEGVDPSDVVDEPELPEEPEHAVFSKSTIGDKPDDCTETASPGDWVSINHEGRMHGQLFDKNPNLPNGEPDPLTFQLGKGQLIAGTLILSTPQANASVV